MVRWLLHLILWPLLLLVLVAVLLYVPPVQDFVRGKAVGFLSKKIGTEVRLEHLALRFPVGVSLDGLYVEDQQGDTLLSAGSLKARLSVSGLLDKRILLSGVQLADVRATVAQSADSVFNFDFIIAAFVSADTTTPEPADTTGGWGFSITDVALRNVVFDLDLRPSQLAMDLRLGELLIDLDRFELDPQRYHVNGFVLCDTRVDMRTVSGPSEPDTYPALSNPLDSLDIRFAELGMENVAFTMSTTNTGDSLWLVARSISAATDSIDLTRQQLALEHLTLQGFHFGMLEGDTTSASPSTVEPPWLDQADGFRYFVRDWNVTAKDLRIRDSGIALHTGTIAKPATLFDPAHLVVNGIDLGLRDVVLNNDRLALAIDALEARTGPDGTPVRLSTTIEATPEAIVLSKGEVSAEGNTVHFAGTVHQGELATLYRTPERVPLTLDVRTDLDLPRLRPLLTALGLALPADLMFTETLATELRAAGTVERMDTLALKIAGDQGSAVRIKGRFAQLNAWPRSEFVADVDELTMGPGLREAVQAFVPPGTVLPERLTMQAHGSGKDGSLRADIALDSDLGAVKGKVSADGWSTGLPDAFGVDLDVDGFRVARFTGDTTLGPVSLHVKGNGSRMNTAQREAHVEIVPKALRYHGKDLSSFHAVADVLGDSVRVDVKTDAEPLDIDLQARGIWPRNEQDSLSAHVDLLVTTLHLHELGLLPYELNVAGQWTGHAAFTRDGQGRFDLTAPGMRLSNAQRDFTFERFDATGFLGADSTAFDIDSDALTLLYHTNMPVDSLLPNMERKMGSFFSADTSSTPAVGQRMDLELTLPRTEWLSGLVVPELQAIRLETLKGSYDGDNDQLQLDLALPYLAYDSIQVFELRTAIAAKGPRLTGNLSVERIDRDSLYLTGLSVETATGAGVLTTVLHVKDAETERYRIGTELRNDAGVRTVHLQEDLVLDSRTWSADPANLLRLVRDGVEAEHFLLSSEQERVELITDPEQTRIALTAFKLGTLAHIFSSTDSIPVAEGTITGDVRLPRTEQALLQADVTVDGLRVLGTDLGTLRMQAREKSAGLYHAEAGLSHTTNRFNAEAEIATGTTTTVDAEAALDLQDLSFLEPFVRDFVFSLGGGVKGDVRYQQRGEQIGLDGALTFAKAAVGVVMTGAVYTMPNETVRLDEAGAHFDDFDLLDSLGNTFRLDGDVLLTNPANPGLDLRVRTEKFQLVDSPLREGALFFGDLMASADLRIKGTATNPVLRGDLGVLPGTLFSVVLPGSKVELVDAEGIVIFVDDLSAVDTLTTRSDSEVLRDSLKAQLPGIELDLAIKIDKAAQFAVVLDPTTGDQATFSGSGDLVFRYKPDGEIFLSGPFILESGGYTLEFYGLVKKRFDLVQGSSVRWNGDPVEAVMDIKARYISNSAPYPLVAGNNAAVAESERNRLQQPLPFEVVITVAGNMDAPKIDFGLDLPRDLRNSYGTVDARLEELARPGNTEDRNRQVFGLLVMNSFIQDESEGGPPSSGIASTAARNSVNGLLTDQMNKLTGKYIQGVNISLGVNTYDQASGNQTYQRTSVDYKVSKRVLNDRLSFEVGGSVGVDEQNSQVSNVSNTRAAQYAILYDLTPDGRFRIRGFQENSYDLYDGDITNMGVAFMFTRDFEENERARASGRATAKDEQQEEKQRQRKAEDEAEERKKADKKQDKPRKGTPGPKEETEDTPE